MVCRSSFNIGRHKLGIGIRYDAAEETFSGIEASGFSGGDARVLKAVSSCSHSHAVNLCFVGAH